MKQVGTVGLLLESSQQSMPPWAQRERERETPRGHAPTFHLYDPRQNTENKGRGQPHQAKVWSVKKKLVKGGKKKIKHNQVPEVNSQKFFKVVEKQQRSWPNSSVKSN